MTRIPPLLQSGDALFLDFDGTLVEIAQRPDLVHVPAGLRACLAELQVALGGALAIVTGRRLASVDRYLELPALPGAGLHGAELRDTSGQLNSPPPSPRVQEAAAVLRKTFADVPGLLIEDKDLSVALHYRNVPQYAGRCEQALLEIAERLHLSPLHGKQVIEARAAPVNKGDGIRALLELPAFRGRRPVFAGDDLTDEYGFDAVAKAGGFGIKVGAGDSAADHHLGDVAALHRWLERSLRHLSVIPAKAGIKSCAEAAPQSPGFPASKYPG